MEDHARASCLVTRSVEVTQRQYEVVYQLIYDGADNETIARRMRIKTGTVNDHMKAILKAAGFCNRTELAVAMLKGEVHMKKVNRSEPLK